MNEENLSVAEVEQHLDSVGGVETVTVSSLWAEIQGDVNDINYDLAKTARGSNAAGVRARKALRAMRDKISALVKLTLAVQKQKVSDKPDAE